MKQSKMHKWTFVLVTVLIAVMTPLVGACTDSSAGTTVTTTVTASPTQTDASAKYVFLFIGDGLGMPQRNSAELYLAALNNSANPESVKLAMHEFPAQGASTTYADGAVITDSAAAATALATGYKTASGVISMNTAKTTEYETMAEMAQDMGWKVGIISSVSIDHATPACFYAHEPTRKNYYEIDVALANSDFDFFGGGGMLAATGDGTQPDAMQIAADNGYTIADTRAEFDALTAGSGKVIAVNPQLQDSQALHYELDRADNDVSLAEYTAKAIELLDNSNGFFIMVEGGKIDWACHANDATASIYDTIAFDDAVKEALDFYNEHPDDTLIVVTGDHECGGMTIGFAGTKYASSFNILQEQGVSFVEFNETLAAYKETHTAANARLTDLAADIETAFGLELTGDSDMALTATEMNLLQNAFEQSMLNKEERASDDATYLLYGGYEPLTVTLTHILNQKAGIAWTSYSHTGVPVPTSAIGPGCESFNGYYDNTDIAKKIMNISGLS